MLVSAELDRPAVEEPTGRTYPRAFTVEDHPNIVFAREHGADNQFANAWTELNSRIGIPLDVWTLAQVAGVPYSLPAHMYPHLILDALL